MGGTWDATNLVDGEVAIVTPIGMDHVAELGPTLEDIAGEKAGILKPGATAVFREQEPAAAAVLAGRAAEVGSTPRWEGEDWEVEERLLAVGGQAFRLRGLLATYEDLYLPLFGDVRRAQRGRRRSSRSRRSPASRSHDDTLREGLASCRARGGSRSSGTSRRDPARRCAQSGRSGGPRRGDARVLPVAASASGARDQREQGSRRHLRARSPRSPTRRTWPQRQRAERRPRRRRGRAGPSRGAASGRSPRRSTPRELRPIRPTSSS